MRGLLSICLVPALMLASEPAAAPDGNAAVPEGRKLNNLVAVLLDVAPAPTAESFPFVRPSDGWIFISFATRGEGSIRLTLDQGLEGEAPI